MSRTTLMTTGIVLILIGIQMNLVESFVLTSRATRAWDQRKGIGLSRGFEVVPGNYINTTNGYFRGSDVVTTGANGAGTAATQRGLTVAQTSSFPYSTPNYQRSTTNQRTTSNFQRTPVNSRVPAYQASYAQPAVANNYGGPQKMLTPPKWFCWPPIFLGSVMFLFSAASHE